MMRDDGYENESKRRRSKIVIVLSSLILVGITIAVLETYIAHNSKKPPPVAPDSDSAKMINSLCETTDFKQTCHDTLSISTGNKTDLGTLIMSEFDEAKVLLLHASEKSLSLHDELKDRYDIDATTLVDCKDLLYNGYNDLRRTISVFPNFDSTDYGDLKSWLSAAITFHETCWDEFQNKAGAAAMKMERLLNFSSEVTRNGLAMVDQFFATLVSYQGHGLDRRPTDTDPIWLDMARKHIMEAKPGELMPDFVVAQDGTGNATSINDALTVIPKNNEKPFVIFVKEGIYREVVRFDHYIRNVVLIGDGPTRTKITNNKNFADGVPFYRTATVGVSSYEFIAKDIAFENSAGPLKQQAVALRVKADKAIFLNCHIHGHQNTLYLPAYRQFYRDCIISGTVDFIIGDASTLFQNCKMVIRKPGPNQQCTVTAQGRIDHREPTGIVLQNCSIVADETYIPHRKLNKAFLGRPWKEFSRTIVMDTYIDDSIHPAGWIPMMGDFGIDTCFYAEFNNRGPGSSKEQRVKWMGVKDIDRDLAEEFTPERFLESDYWVAPIGVPYFSGLTSKNTFEISPSPQPSKGLAKKRNKKKHK